MLSAYIAFLVGYSPDLPTELVFIVPIGFVAGYILDRLASVKSIWIEDKMLIIQLVVLRYILFLMLAGAFFALGLFLGSR